MGFAYQSPRTVDEAGASSVGFWRRRRSSVCVHLRTTIARRISGPGRWLPVPKSWTGHLLWYGTPMHLPHPSPPLRGALLRLVSWLAGYGWFRDLLLAKVRKDARIPELPQ